jgi:hypothetical protein
MRMKPLLLTINPEYFYRTLDWHHQPYQLVGKLARVEGFDRYNNFIDLNAVFSSQPAGDPVDRTSTVTGPFAFAVQRPWQAPTFNGDLEQVFEHRVKTLVNSGKTLNLCWSGGIDSTSMVVAFLKHAKNIDQLRVCYCTYTLYENRDFFEFLTKNYPTLEMLDISGDVYLDTVFDGIMVNGHGGDEFTASLDESFFDAVGYEGLHQPWQTLIKDPVLQEFCTEYFKLAQRSIDTVLEARWWFYAATKSQVYAPRDSVFATNASTSAFFDCQEFEDYMWHNTDKIIAGNDYRLYKEFLKKYIYEFDQNDNQYTLAKKVNSPQFIWYTNKKIELLGQQWIAYLEDGTRIQTPSLPLLSEREFKNTYGDSLEYLYTYR